MHDLHLVGSDVLVLLPVQCLQSATVLSHELALHLLGDLKEFVHVEQYHLCDRQRS